MRYEATIVLEIMRKAIREHVDLNIGDAFAIILDVLHITDEETIEIGEIIKADVREKNASYVRYGEICEELNQINLR